MNKKIKGIEPQSGIDAKKIFRALVIILFGIFLTLSLTKYVSKIDDFKELSDVEISETNDISEYPYITLEPGYHLIDKYPFIVKVKVKSVKFIVEHTYYYTVSKNVLSTDIPSGYVGVLISDAGVNRDHILKTGMYFINPYLYKVVLLDIREKERVWSSEKDLKGRKTK